MYVTLEWAKEELKQRGNDLELRRKVREFVGDIPDFLRNGPRAVLARHIATPNIEFFRLASTAKTLGLRPACSGYVGDRFTTKNPDKLLLGRMTFFHGADTQGKDGNTNQTIFRFNQYDGKPFVKIKTLWGEGFVTYHHRLLSEKIPEFEIGDITEWIRRLGGDPRVFYPRLLALFICYGILFENFHLEGREKTFTHEVILPALARVREFFGISPLIVPSVPVERERESFWAWYPGFLEKEVEMLVSGSLQPKRTAFASRNKDGRVVHG